jgi:hypothetical protein
MSILTEYSIWLIFVCILIGALFSFVLYFKNKDIGYGRNTQLILYLLRGISITLIAFLFLGPLAKMTIKKKEKPILVFALDNSESLLTVGDSFFNKQLFLTQYEQLKASFGSKYEIVQYSIGDQATLNNQNKFDFNDKSTQFSDFFDEMNTIYSNRNVGAVILFTDGIFNKGSNPVYQVNGAKYPVYTVGLGNTEQQTDLLISNIVHNSQTFKGNIFPVEIKIAANKLKGKNYSISIFEGNNEVFHSSIPIASNQYFETIKTNFVAKNKGIQKYKVVLSHIEGEITYKNNTSFFFIEVIDQKEKIAIIYNAPHPDITAIKSALEISDRYDIDIFSIDQFKGSIQDYSLVILHQLPSVSNSSQNILNEIQKSKVSTLFILGSKTDYQLFNTLKFGLSINKNKELTNEALPLYNENFVTFSFSENAKKLISKFPPMITPFGNYNLNIGSNIFLYQKIAGVNTNYPLILFSESNGTKTGVITGSGIWQWKIYDHLYENNFDVFNEIINKMVLFLSVKNDKSYFRVTNQNVFNENEPIQFDAELYNESYELMNSSDINMVIKSVDGKSYSAQFSKENNAYHLNIGELPPNDYSWTATTQLGKNKYSKTGSFSIRELVTETQNLVANYGLLKSISKATNGAFFHQNEMDKIEKTIKNNENIKTLAVYDKSYHFLMNSYIYFIIIIVLLAIEWFIRKWNGGY